MIGTASLNGVNLSSSNTLYNLATIRIRSSRPYAVIVPAGYETSAISNSMILKGMYLNATPSSAFSYTNYSDNVEYDITITNNITAGTRIAGWFYQVKVLLVVTASESGNFKHFLINSDKLLQVYQIH
jgi:hypothetical protein